MEQVTATRSELLARRESHEIARRGRDLLEQKRDQLLGEFRRIADQVLSEAGELERAAAEARRALAVTEAFDGPDAVASAGLAGRTGIPMTVRTVTVMGVRLADIETEPLGRPRAGRGYSLEGGSARLDDAAACFEAELELIVDLAGRELRLRRLVDEIAKTTRRVNALEYVVIPQLQREAAVIQSILDERERQDRFRLKRAKQYRAARRKEQHG